jgi:23S rRNA (uracil1939-C5)-methyltransferase
MVCYVVNGNGLKQENILIEKLRTALPNLESVIFNSNRENTNVVLGRKNRTAYGKEYITDILCGLKFKISPLSFYQVNRNQAEKLYGIAKNYANLNGDEVLLDLYCGTGTIGLSMADKCKSLIGVEIVEDAIKDAVENAKLNNIDNARFICSDASETATKLQQEGVKPDVIIIDPPRKGCDSNLIDTIARFDPQRIVYVSCDSETLARDLKQFAEYNYSVKEITPVDLFSRTPHVENVALITKKQN